MNHNNTKNNWIFSASLLLGLLLLGLFIYKGLKTFSDKDRVVTVKGLAEMNIKATKATILTNISLSGDDLQSLINESETKKKLILDYFKETGYSNNHLKIGNLDIIDREKYYELQWIDGQRVNTKIDRFTISQSISIAAKNIEGTNDEMSKIKLDLVTKNLSSNISADYVFPELNTIKPQLIAESTKNARIAGEQFANDSQAKLGKIKTASQGQISIVGNYYFDEEASTKPAEPFIQKARVVSTIVFFLE